MNRSARLLVLLALTVVTRFAAAQIPVNAGWETKIVVIERNIGDVDLGEWNVRHPILIFKYDQFEFLLPWLSWDGAYAVCEDFKPELPPPVYWKVPIQSPEELSAVFQIPIDQFQKPYDYYLPYGWWFVIPSGVLLGVSQLWSRRTRFYRLWKNPWYRAAVSNYLFGEPRELARYLPITVREMPQVDDDAFDRGLQTLTDMGVSRQRAERRLEFMLRYLSDYNLIKVRPATNEEVVSDQVSEQRSDNPWA